MPMPRKTPPTQLELGGICWSFNAAPSAAAYTATLEAIEMREPHQTAEAVRIICHLRELTPVSATYANGESVTELLHQWFETLNAIEDTLAEKTEQAIAATDAVHYIGSE